MKAGKAAEKRKLFNYLYSRMGVCRLGRNTLPQQSCGAQSRNIIGGIRNALEIAQEVARTPNPAKTTSAT